MKGTYSGSEAAPERVLAWVEVVKTHDRSNQVVQVGGQRFTISADALNAAEPSGDELKDWTTRIVQWEKAEHARLEKLAADTAHAAHRAEIGLVKERLRKELAGQAERERMTGIEREAQAELDAEQG